MKKIFKCAACFGLVGCMTLTSCLDSALETSPTTSITSDGVFSNINTAMVPLNGIYRMLYSTWSPQGNEHQSFGISSYTLMADVMGDDFIQSAAGSGWFWYDCLYQVKDMYTSTAWRSYDTWNAYYTQISNANYIITGAADKEGTDKEWDYIIGQAYAIRSYSYFMLAQTFARTYKGHESEPCCPIYTEATVAGSQGKGRATVQEVYDQIVADINKAVELLEGTTRQHISHMDYSVSLGIKARIALVMEDWKTAKEAAKAAIEASGCQVLPVASFSGLNSTSAANVMWGAAINSDQSGMYASFFSHVDADGTGYASKGAYKQINKILYDGMNANDTRRAWWDPTDARNEKGGYMQKKFRFADVQTWTGDYIWMRVEEMYLTAAEAECRLGEEAAAKEDLTAVMSQRVEGYTCTKTGTSLGKLTSDVTGSLLDEIITQRRIELWGEFGRIYDIRRLKQGFVRTTEMGWPTEALLTNRPSNDPESYMWVLTIPQSEFDGNAAMNPETDQNPVGDTK